MGCSSDKVLQRFFYKFGHLVFKYRWVFMIFPIVLSGALSSGFMLFEQRKNDANDTIYVFTPWNRRSLRELAVLARLWPLTQDRFMPGKTFEARHWIDIVITATDENGVLRHGHLEEIRDLNDHIMNNFSITIGKQNGAFELYYMDLCLTWEWECYENGHVELFLNREELSKYMDLTYPRGGSGDTPAYFGNQIGGVTVNESAKNEILDAKAIRLIYNLAQDPDDPGSLLDFYSKKFKYTLQDYLINEYRSDLISLGLFHSTSLDQALEHTANSFIPNFCTTVFVLTMFAVGCSFVCMPPERNGGKNGGASAIRVDWARSKPLLAMLGISAAGLAVLSSYGLLMYAGMGFNVIASVVPFLIFAIGVDNMFILTAAWHRTSMALPPSERLALTLSDAAVAITITSLTDALSFSIGCYTEIPGVWIFCSFTAVAIAFNYLYQITFFASFMAFAGIAEHEGRHCLLYYPKVVPPGKAESQFQSVFNTGTVYFSPYNSGETVVKTVTTSESSTALDAELQIVAQNHTNCTSPHTHSERDNSFTARFFREYYGPLVLRKTSKIVIAIMFVLYLLVAIWGCFTLHEGLTPEHIIVEDHYAADYYTKIEHFWVEGLQAQVVIEHPPNFANYSERMQFEQLLEEFESTQHSMGRRGTVFWYLEYLRYLDELNAEVENTTEMWGEKLRNWIKYTGGKNLWEMDMVWSKERDGVEPRLLAFRFKIGLKDYLDSNDHRQVAVDLRHIADSHPEYGITVYHEYFPFADQYLIILPSTLRNITIAIACMIAVSLILIPSVPCALIIVLAIVTIDLGVLGYMAWWGVHLDAISMIAIIMSIGFAVDLTAHISYAYAKAPEGYTAEERALHALETLGWPVFQGGFSTILGVCVLASVNAYIILTWFKTVLLVITFGMVHSLVFLPVALTVFLPDGTWRFFERKGAKVGAVPVPQGSSSRNKLEKKDSNTSQKIEDVRF